MYRAIFVPHHVRPDDGACANEVRKLIGIAHEEDRRIVAHQIPIAFFGVAPGMALRFARFQCRRGTLSRSVRQVVFSGKTLPNSIVNARLTNLPQA